MPFVWQEHLLTVRPSILPQISAKPSNEAERVNIHPKVRSELRPSCFCPFIPAIISYLIWMFAGEVTLGINIFKAMFRQVLPTIGKRCRGLIKLVDDLGWISLANKACAFL